MRETSSITYTVKKASVNIVLLFQLLMSEHIAYMTKMYDSVQRACHEYENV